MREKSGVWSGSVLGFANGLDVGSVAEAAAFAFAGAARTGCDAAASPIAADASRTVRIISLPKINHLGFKRCALPRAEWIKRRRPPQRASRPHSDQAWFVQRH